MCRSMRIVLIIPPNSSIETATVDYHSSLADQGKQTSVFSIFPFQFSVCSKQTEVAVFCQFRFRIYIYIYIYSSGNIYICIYFIVLFQYTRKTELYIYMMPFQTENGKWTPRWFFLIRLPFAHCANRSLSFVRLLTKNKQKLSIANGLIGLPIFNNTP
jgi:hypothetical protein